MRKFPLNQREPSLNGTYLSLIPIIPTQLIYVGIKSASQVKIRCCLTLPQSGPDRSDPGYLRSFTFTSTSTPVDEPFVKCKIKKDF